MNFSLKILGTASAVPISDRNPSAQMLSVNGRLFLIDCGEGVQQQMRRMHLSFLKVEAIFITHIHGDHVFGLFGLLSSMAMYGRTADLYIYGPQALGSVIKFYRSFFADESAFEIVFKPADCTELTPIHKSKAVAVSTFPLRHKIPCFGYRFDEIISERRRAGNPACKGKSFAYCSDTVAFANLSEYVRGVDVLYHEATYMNDMSDKAVNRWHSTTSQAAQCALTAGAGRLLVGHYSSRILDFDAYIAECMSIFPDSVAVQDGDVFDF